MSALLPHDFVSSSLSLNWAAFSACASASVGAALIEASLVPDSSALRASYSGAVELMWPAFESFCGSCSADDDPSFDLWK